MTVQYDPFSDDVIHGDNHGIYKRLRDESPMHYLEAYDAFAPSDVKYDISQAEFQGDALTTAAWMWDDAAAAARRHKARHTLDE